MKNKSIVYKSGIIVSILLIIATLFLSITGILAGRESAEEYKLKGSYDFFRATTAEEEDYSSDEDTLCPVTYITADKKYECNVTYSFEQWEKLKENDKINGYVYENGKTGRYIAFNHIADAKEISVEIRNKNADEKSNSFAVAMALGFAAIGIIVMLLFSKFFTTYEKCWYISIIVLASVFSILFPEEDCNGIKGLLIMFLYLLDTILNISCELLISKQSKWNFIVSVFVEITEILICVVLAYRFATMATTLLFWLPIDIISFINWNRHPDKVKDELTEVRTLTGWQEVLIITAIVVWTAVIGWLLSGLNIATDLFGGNKTMATIVCYMDACASAVGVANGVFILFRYREQWIAWYIEALLEAAINILSGQWVLLVLKIGYLTNTTYGYIKWTEYIRSHKSEKLKESIL